MDKKKPSLGRTYFSNLLSYKLLDKERNVNILELNDFRSRYPYERISTRVELKSREIGHFVK